MKVLWPFYRDKRKRFQKMCMNYNNMCGSSATDKSLSVSKAMLINDFSIIHVKYQRYKADKNSYPEKWWPEIQKIIAKVLCYLMKMIIYVFPLFHDFCRNDRNENSSVMGFIYVCDCVCVLTKRGFDCRSQKTGSSCISYEKYLKYGTFYGISFVEY